MKSITVQVPATSANCGPGFDCLGVALNLYNLFTFEPDEQASSNTYTFEGFGADLLEQEDHSQNLVGIAMERVFKEVNAAPIYGRIHSNTQIPPSRGLGSSSTAIVGGLLLANAYLQEPLNKDQLLLIANDMEGHPDNVAPAIMGNLVCAVGGNDTVYHSHIDVPSNLTFAVVVPEVIVETSYARSVLPTELSYKEAVANVGFATLFVGSMIQNRMDNLSVALQDYLHVPYRKTLIPYCDDVFIAAKENGAYGSTISGSGSTLIAYCSPEHAVTVADAMSSAFINHDIDCRRFVLHADREGAKVVKIKYE